MLSKILGTLTLSFVKGVFALLGVIVVVSAFYDGRIPLGVSDSLWAIFLFSVACMPTGVLLNE